MVAGQRFEPGDLLFEPLRTGLRKALMYVPVPELVRAQGGEDAGLLGAALQARELSRSLQK
jgi:glucokinase